MSAASDDALRWRVLREAWDAAARDAGLAARLAAALPERPHLLDLSADAGALFRWLAPRLGRPQAWTLLGPDQDSLTEAFSEIADWAERGGLTVTWPKRTLLVHSPRGAWRVEGRIVDPTESAEALPFDECDAVVTSGVPAPWLEELVGLIEVPFYASLCPAGRPIFLPRLPGDATIAAALRGDAGDVAAAVAALFADEGFEVHAASSDWSVPGAALHVTAALAEAQAEAALSADRRHAKRILGWAAARARQARRRRLAVRIPYRDVLALVD